VIDQGYIDALQRERAHYVRTGQPARVALVDAELKRAGAVTKATPDPVVVTATVEAPETAARPRATRKAARAT
jgi:hypothetical protein